MRRFEDAEVRSSRSAKVARVESAGFRSAKVQTLRSLRLRIQKWEVRSSRSAKVQRFKSAEVQKCEGSEAGKCEAQ